MMNKLEYQVPLAPKGVADPWDERPRDAAECLDRPACAPRT